MSISLSQMIPPADRSDGRPDGLSIPASLPALYPSENPNRDSSPSAERSPGQSNTDVRVDDHHQVYYEFVDASTGDVLFEIPPEALREIAESLNISLDGSTSSRRVDVKS
jgi:hypothetical protein